MNRFSVVIFKKRDKNYIFSLAWFKVRGTELDVFSGVGLDGTRRQLANAGWQVLITLLAGEDGTEDQWSATVISQQERS